MQHPFKALSLSYKNAPIAMRESVALNEINCKNLLHKIKEFTDISEALVLSTCNRTEIYYTSEKDLSREILKLIALEKGFVAIKNIAPYFISITQPIKAVAHLFRVALGLESQVTGDFQILNQVKQAYQWTADLNMAGPFLHRMLHSIFNTNKRVINETAFRDGAASVAYATVELAEELTTQLNHPRVLMIGVGEIGANVCKNFQKSKIRNLFIVNRTHHKAVTLAQRVNAQAVYLENIREEIAAADVIISAVSGDCFFLNKDALQNIPDFKEKIFIDLAMPRSIAQDLEDLPNVQVFNIDTIKNRATKALEKRLAAIPEVEQFINEAITEFKTWAKETAVSPAIRQFKNQLEQIRQQEISRFLKNSSVAEQELIELVTSNILNKIVKLPVLELKAACRRGEPESLLAGLSRLFNLEKQAV